MISHPNFLYRGMENGNRSARTCPFSLMRTRLLYISLRMSPRPEYSGYVVTLVT